MVLAHSHVTEGGRGSIVVDMHQGLTMNMYLLLDLRAGANMCLVTKVSWHCHSVDSCDAKQVLEVLSPLFTSCPYVRAVRGGFPAAWAP